MQEVNNALDAQLRDRVLRQFAFTRDFNGKHVSVRTDRGCVTLVGSVASYAEKMAAAEAAKRLFGVRSITNDLVVTGTRQIADADLESSANEALAAWSEAAPAVTARVRDGRIILEGTVDWMYQRAAAEAAVAYLPGVRGVDNRVTLGPGGSSARLQERIDQALLRLAGVDWKRVVVEVNHGIVRLTGSVFSMMERDEVERAVWAIPGVVSINNHLDVSSRRWW